MQNIKIVLLSIATLLFLFLSLYFLNENTKTENSKRQLSRQIATMGVKEFSFDLNKAMTGRKALDILCIAQNGDEKYLSELMNGNPILIYRYTQAGCIPCYEEQIRLTQEVFQDFCQLVIILSSYYNERDFSRRALNIPIYHIPFIAFDWQLEKLGIPYFFVLHPCMRISNIYVPDEHEPELNKRYLESIKRLLQ